MDIQSLTAVGKPVMVWNGEKYYRLNVGTSSKDKINLSENGLMWGWPVVSFV